FCQDRDGNFWAGDSGPFTDTPGTAGRGYQLYQFDPNGKLLRTLGKPGVSKAGHDTFLGPTACVIAPNGDLIVADGHWPRPSTARCEPARVNSWARTRWRSIRVADCSSRTDPTTGSKSSTGICTSWMSGAISAGPAELRS